MSSENWCQEPLVLVALVMSPPDFTVTAPETVRALEEEELMYGPPESTMREERPAVMPVFEEENVEFLMVRFVTPPSVPLWVMSRPFVLRVAGAFSVAPGAMVIPGWSVPPPTSVPVLVAEVRDIGE